MKKIISTILIFIYAIIAITVTILLLSFNEYKCSEIGGYTVYIVQDDALEPTYKRGDLLLIRNEKDSAINVGDKVFVYKVISNEEYEVALITLEDKEDNASTTMYRTEKKELFDASFLIGREKNATVIHNLGTILAILESRWGYLFLVVVVALLLLLRELFELYLEIKYGSETEGKKQQNNI